ncbi:MAG: response regulator [Desulfobulbus sp.]|jgi:DNA-binding NtrC family response regulator|uniref:response regulator n=1 Tax=Desulfobulbus sp. TaxID=895 RepID=UPI00284205ED|nr:response regulator [Desulfobulbus sp.]MDR2551140.1 response regulator [Desulfobulbus sp.]
MDKKQREFKVLLVDDEDIFREATARQLSVRGFIVLTADSGEAAVESVKNDPPEVVVLDQQMPGMHGSDTFIAIKKIDPLIEVIMLTGNTSVDNAIELMQMGTFDYLMKPINIDELLYKIEDAYTRKKLNEKQQREAGQ